MPVADNQLTLKIAVGNIGRVGQLSLTEVPWPIPVLLTDVRMRYGIIDYRVADPQTKGDVGVWVEAWRVSDIKEDS